LLEDQNLKLRVEDLVDHPVMIDQLALLAARKKAIKEVEIEELEVEDTVEPSDPPSKKGIKKLLRKSVRFAKGKSLRKEKD
jgi:hypothetical protein